MKMMSLSPDGPHPKILTLSIAAGKRDISCSENIPRRRERGYALVALLAVMTVIAIVALAAAPSIRQQAIREREREAIFRGEELAEAIRVYYSHQVRTRGPGFQSLPTSMDQLLEGVPIGSKKLQVIRPSAARDPLSETGEWRLVRPGGPEMADFVREVMLYSENIRPNTTDPQLKAQEGVMAPFTIMGTNLSGSSSARDDNYSGPFIGVASRSNNNSVIYYYGIARHDGWIFTPIFR